MNSLIENEITKNAQTFLKDNNSFKKIALEYFTRYGLNDKISKLISPRFAGPAENLKKIIVSDLIDNRGTVYFIDGSFDAKNSILPSSIEAHPLSEAEVNSFLDSSEALNAVAAISPTHLIIKKNSSLDFPLTIVHMVTELGVNKIVSPRIKITCEENSEIAIIELFTSENSDFFQYTTNSSTTFELLENAKVEHIKLVKDAKKSLHLGWTVAHQAKDSRFNSTVITTGQAAATNNLQINLNGSGAETSANSLFTLARSETNNIFTTINHKVSHTHSTQLCKGILKDDSFGIFNGNIIVSPDAQEITSTQLNKNLLLSKKAHIETRPQLLVSADDVKCSHGATVGQLSDEEAFYLESRGINKERAKEMLMKGFSNEIIHLVKNKKVRDLCETMV